MLTCLVSLRNEAGPWAWDRIRGGWTRGPHDLIRPLANPALETCAYTDGQATLLMVRERIAGRPLARPSADPAYVSHVGYSKHAAEAAAWPGQAVCVELIGHEAHIRTGLGGVCPLYLTHAEGRLYASWQLMDLRKLLSAGRLNEREMARLLTGQLRYSRSTVFENVVLLTERATASATETSLRLDYPEPAARPMPSELAEGVGQSQILQAFDDLLRHVFARYPFNPRETAAHLSGGIDSTNLALSLADAYPGSATACAMLLGGTAGAQQSCRRRAIIASASFANDVTILAAHHPAMRPDGVRRLKSELVSPTEEPHLEAADALASLLQDGGITTIVTGFGGDEVMGHRENEPVVGERGVPTWLGARVLDLLGQVDDEIAPPTVAPETSLISLASDTPFLARHGMWTLNPFTDSEVVRFGRRLPLVWRKGKRLLHERLAVRGLPDEVVYPPLRENFGELMNVAMSTHIADLFDSWGPGMLLAEHGFVEPSEMAKVVSLARTGRVQPEQTSLFSVAAIELALQSL